jgi:hypothetical protein
MPKPRKTPTAEVTLLKRSRQKSLSADAMCERSHMDLMRVYWIAQKNPEANAEVIRRLDVATEALSDCREKLGDVVHQIEVMLR